jgi:hypothetical protein
MRFQASRLMLVLTCLIFVGGLSATAFADGSHDRTQFGRDISIAPGEEATDVTCFGCSVRVRGHVASDVTTFGGSVVVEDQGEIGGDATTFGGDVRLDKGVKVDGGITLFGGRLHRDPSASIGGDVTNFSGPVWMVLVFGLPLMMLGAFIVLIIWLVRLVTRPAAAAAA